MRHGSVSVLPESFKYFNIEIKQEINVGLDVALIDPKEIHQVMMNLCTNAAQAMKEKGGGLLEVSLAEVEI